MSEPEADNLNKFAMLRYEGQNHRFDSLAGAKAAWEQLTPAQQVHATIVADGTMYEQAEIAEMTL
ncbi:hypothetical protein [Afipia carboxidovorans]|uniref:hypothetical protein n=1 Tax=Afipia carboxidovorans TaxID=40137 RepID=UPI0030930794|nr:hypothetical protein CRBSH125_01090 [Afipia carboxidovorans]